MSKFLISLADGKVRSTHDFPMDFSIAGHYVMDVPTSLQVKAQTESASDLEAAKIAAFMAAHPSLTNVVNDELITSPNVDTAESSRFTVGPDKRTIIFPSGGQIVTSTIAIGSAITSIFAHWYAYVLATEPATPPAAGPPPPDRLLYNYDTVGAAFQEFLPATFTVEVRDSTNTSTLATLTPDAEQAFSFGPGSVRLRFTNNDTVRHYHLSDWILLFG